MLAGPAVAVVTLMTALVVTQEAGVALRDPEHVALMRLVVAAALVAVLAGLDVWVRAGRRSRRLRPSRAALGSVRRERWGRHRVLALAMALVSFFVAYLAYRNLKSVVPLIRPGALFDHQLTALDRSLFGGHQPAALLQGLVGTGAAAHALSTVYMFFFAFIPLSLAVSLVFSPQLEAGLFYTTALSINWGLGAASYFLLPSIGPFHADPAVFAHLPATAVTHLQDALLQARAAYLRAPSAPGAAQSIGAFASLHMSIYVTAVVAAHLIGLRRSVKLTLWLLTVLTAASTVYFGWHYVLDDLGGAALAVMAVALARLLTGFDLRAARRLRVPAIAPEPA